MCDPTDEYQAAYLRYLSYVTVTGNSRQNEVKVTFYKAQINNIKSPTELTHSHGGQTVSASQTFGADKERSKMATAGFIKLRAAVNALKPASAKGEQQEKRPRHIFVPTEQSIREDAERKQKQKTTSAHKKRLEYLLRKQLNTPHELNSAERTFLEAHSHK